MVRMLVMELLERENTSHKYDPMRADLMKHGKYRIMFKKKARLPYSSQTWTPGGENEFSMKAWYQVSKKNGSTSF